MPNLNISLFIGGPKPHQQSLDTNDHFLTGTTKDEK
jgi:hypothetical protein